jgi:MFS family permease
MSASVHAGQLNCECLPFEAENLGAPQVNLRLAAGFGLSLLAQTCVLVALPNSAQILTPKAAWVGIPYALWLLGSLVATFPASLLEGLFGRRTAFALGGSLGLAGGLLAGWSFIAGQFIPLCLGAFWLGLAQGFGLYYRHAALGGGGRKALALVSASGALVMILAPTLTRLLVQNTPLASAQLFLGAGLVSLLAVGVALTLPAKPQMDREIPRVKISGRIFFGTSLCAGFAWYVMTVLMGKAPVWLAGCGLGLAPVTGLIAWHMLAMYVPSALLMPFVSKIGLRLWTGAGLLALGCAYGLTFHIGLLPLGLALTMGGCGWSLVTSGVLMKMYSQGYPSRSTIAAQDGLIFLGAISGALT